VKWTTLEEVSTLISKGTTPTTLGCSFVPEGIPFLRAEDVTGTAINPKAVAYYISAETDKILSRSRLQPGDLLITIAGTLGRIGYVPMNAPPLNCNQAVAFVRLDPQVIDLFYAGFACQAQIADLLTLRKIGTIGNLNLEQVRQFKIPFPPLCEQKRIATLLNRADRLRRARRYALELTDTFLPAPFLELFGETLIEKGRWPEVELADLIRKGDKVNYGVVQPGFDLKEGVPLVRVADLEDLESSVPNLKLIATDIDERHSASRLVGDELLIACVGSIGKVAKAFPKLKGFNIARAVARVPGDWNKIDRNFLVHYLAARRAQHFWLNETRTVSQPTLNILQIEQTPVIMPPLPLQQKFAALVERVERLRAVQREALRQAEHLFASLLHRAFSGEL
jgi:type I restriction enzyme S subunit